MKATILTASIVAIIGFSGASMAGKYTDEQREDVLHGVGIHSSSPSQMYIASDDDNRGSSSAIKYNASETSPAGSYVPYTPVSGDRDNNDSLKDQVS